jgi:hypothetical protein
VSGFFDVEELTGRETWIFLPGFLVDVRRVCAVPRDTLPLCIALLSIPIGWLLHITRETRPDVLEQR